MSISKLPQNVKSCVVILLPIDTISLYHRMDTYCSLDLSQTANYSKNISIGNINFILSIVTKMNETSIILQLQGMAGIWQNNPKVCINRPKSVNEIYKNFCHHSIYILSLSNIIFLVKQNTLNANIWSAFVSLNCRLLLYNILNLINWFVHRNKHWCISAKISHATHFHAVR